MAANIDDLTIEFIENEQTVVKEVDKVILSKGAWATILYRYQDWDRKNHVYGPDKFSIRRYQKRNGEFQQRSKFTISSKDQATKIIEALNGWIGEDASSESASS